MYKTAAVAILLLVGLAAVATWPVFVMRDFLETVVRQDTRQIAAFLDADAIRSDLERQMRARISRDLATIPGAAGVVARQMAERAAATTLEAIVGDDSLALFLSSTGVGGRQNAPIDVVWLVPRARFSSVSQVRFVFDESSAVTAVTLERRGLVWRVTGLEIGETAAGEILSL